MKSKIRHSIKDDRWHILNRIGMYLGSSTEAEFNEFIIENGKIISKTLVYVPAIIKMINEIIDNSADVLKNKRSGKIDILMDRTSVTVKDNGDGIPIEYIKDLDGTNVLIPFSCWGKAKAGSNFNNDEDDATTIGTNGVGSYCTNVHSDEFIGITCDGKKEFKGIWKENALKYSETTKAKKTKGTTVTFKPSLSNFNIKELSDDCMMVIKQRLINLSVSYPSITFSFNKEVIKTGRTEFLKMFGTEGEIFQDESFSFGIFSNVEDDFHQFSLINGLNIKSGNHTDYIMKYIVDGIKDKLPKKFESIKPGDIKNKLFFVFIGDSFPNIQWEGQTKEHLKNSNSDIRKYLGNEWLNIIPKIAKNKSITDPITLLYQAKIDAEEKLAASKADKENKKIKALKFRKAVNDPENLLFIEGDTAIKGANAGYGRSIFSQYPLGGVGMNVVRNTMSKITANTEYKEFMSILNFQFSGDNIISKMSHKNLISMTDADLDGNLITGIWLGFITKFIPEAYNEGRVKILRSPVKVALDNKEKMIAAFLNEDEYQSWLKENPNNKKYTIEYKKGLASMSPSQWKEFTTLRNYDDCIETVTATKEDLELQQLWLSDDADFRKAKMNDRINNVKTFPKRSKTISLSTFYDRDYCDYAIYRTKLRIPQLVDGFAETQRKSIFTMLKENIVKKTKVADLAAKISLFTKYHHGSTSIETALSNMIPEFNNQLQLIQEDGSYSSRSERELPAARYVETRLYSYTKTLFNNIDNEHFVIKQETENQEIEPEYMIPCLPMLLINGQTQTAMGYACNILPRDKKIIIKIIKDLLTGKRTGIPSDIIPCSPLFKGTIKINPKGGYRYEGIVEEGKRGSKIITEVPPKYNRLSYLKVLEELKDRGDIKSYKENIDGDNFWIEVKGVDSKVKNLITFFKLYENKTDNLTMVDSNKNLKRFESVGEVLHEYVMFMMNIYVKRKKYIIDKYQKDIYINESKIRFITEFNDDIINIKGKKRVDINKDLTNRKYLKFENSYNYLLAMNFGSLTFERIEDLKKEILKMKEYLLELKNKSESQMWIEDIDKFEKEFKNDHK